MPESEGGQQAVPNICDTTVPVWAGYNGCNNKSGREAGQTVTDFLLFIIVCELATIYSEIREKKG